MAHIKNSAPETKLVSMNPLKKASRIYGWWTGSLLSCLPDQWAGYISGARGNFDLVITHQGDTVFIMTDRGEILDTMSLTVNTGIDLANISVKESVIAGISNTQLKKTEEFVQDEDPPISLSSNTLDFDLGAQNQESNIGSIDLVLDSSSQDKVAIDYAPDLGDQIDVNNVISLNIRKDDDDTVVLDNEDQTLSFIESESEEDTIIIQRNQGKLLQFEPLGNDTRDTTVLFRNDGGKIRQVDSDDLDTQDANELKNTELDAIGIKSSEVDGAGYLIVSKFLKRYQRNKKCLYLLPDNKIFILKLTYPIEALQNIESVLRFDLEKHIPVSFQEVRYFYALNVDADQEKVTAEVAVIKAGEFDLLNQSLNPFLKKGLICTTEKFYKKYGNKINFLEQKIEKSWHSLFKFSNLHPSLNWALLVLLLALPFPMLYQGRAAIEDKPSDEIQRVKELVSAFNTTNAESNFSSLLLGQVNKTHKTVELLANLSQSINREAWLHQFSFKNNEIKVKGEAESATSVSDDLNETGLFESIKFISSIVKNARSGKESFELLLILKTDA